MADTNDELDNLKAQIVAVANPIENTPTVVPFSALKRKMTAGPSQAKSPDLAEPKTKTAYNTDMLSAIPTSDLFDALLGQKDVSGVPSMRTVPGEKHYAYHDDSGNRVGKIAWYPEGVISYKGKVANTISIAKIASDVKGTGLGSQAVEAIKELGRRQNARVVVDWVEPQSVGFWKKMGFDVNQSNAAPGYGGFAIYDPSHPTDK